MANYTVIELQPPPGSDFSSSVATCINASNVVGGSINVPDGAGAIWSDFTPPPVGQLAGVQPSLLVSAPNSAILDLNDHGDAVGVAGVNNTDTEQAFLFKGGVVVNLPIEAGSAANGINNSGLVVGNSVDGSGFVFDSIGRTGVSLADQTFQAVNSTGTAVGIHHDETANETAAILSGGQIVDLGPATDAEDINEQGVAVGGVPGGSAASGIVPAFWDTRLSPTVAQLIPLPSGFAGGIALAINNRGDIVGNVATGGSGPEELFASIFTGGVSTDLNTLIPENSGWVLQEAEDINDNGLIVGQGTFQGQSRGFLLIPVGQPLPGVVTGKVSDRRGNGLSGATVSVLSASTGVTVEVLTDAAGNYATQVLAAGGYTVGAALAGFVSASASVTVHQTVNIENLVLAKRGALTGHVIDVNSHPLSEVIVKLGPQQTVTDASGFYSLSLDPASYTGTVSSPAFTTDNFSVTIPDGTTITRDFVLFKPVPGGLTGIVTDDGSVPVPARVSAEGRTTNTDANGRYMLPGLFPGAITVTVNGGVRFLVQHTTVNVIAGETAEADFALVAKNKL
jgi:protocatechuate 3,4-dioxygenase beta subunit